MVNASVIVDTTGALYAAGQRVHKPSVRLQRRKCCYESPPSLRRASRSKLAGEGAAFGPPFSLVGFLSTPFVAIDGTDL
jgi:hypothetical protein